MSLIVVLGLLGIMIFKPDSQFFNQVKRKLLQESGHPRIVLSVIGVKETNFSKEHISPRIYLNNRYATKQRFCLVKNVRIYAASY